MKSPCIAICQIDVADNTCIGCGRTLDEIKNWRKYTDAERDAIMVRLEEQRANDAQ